MTVSTSCPVCGELARRTVLRLENGRVYDATVCHECERVWEHRRRAWWRSWLLRAALIVLMAVIANDIVTRYIR